MRVSPVVGRAASGPTYEQYQAHIAQRATNGVRAWFANLAVAGSYTSTAGAVQPSWYMYGSPWAGRIFGGAGISGITARMLQHGLPSEAEFNNQIANGFDIFWRTTLFATNRALQSYTRNGFQSGAGTYDAFYLEEIVFWDGEKPMQMLPRLGQGPVSYSLNG